MQTCKLLRDDTVLLSQPKLIEEFGRAGAQFLSQLHYWLEHSKLGQQYQGQKWIYNTETSWADQLRLSVRQFRRHVASLTSKGIIFVEKLNPHKSNRTNYFSINYALLNKLLENPEAPDFVHEDIMSSPSGQNDLFYNDTKTTNKDFNKSEKFEKNPEVVGLEDQVSISQVEQVKNINLKSQKNLIPQPETKLLKAVKEPTKIRNSTIQDMLQIWNETFGMKSPTTMTKALAPCLVAVLKIKFNSNLDLWMDYCQMIKASDYLMGEGFELNLGWALKFTTIDKILTTGWMGASRDVLQAKVKKEDLPPDLTQMQAQILALDEPDTTKEMRLKIAKAIGPAMYKSWFHEAKFLEVDGDIRIIAQNSYIEGYWETHFPWVNQAKG